MSLAGLFGRGTVGATDLRAPREVALVKRTIVASAVVAAVVSLMTALPAAPVHGAPATTRHALIVLAFLTLWTALGYFDWARSAALTIGGLYWHFVDIVWLFIFATLYLSPYVLAR